MPCKGLTDNIEDFRDCVDKLHEIVTKYKRTHRIIIGGDINEELKSATKDIEASTSWILSWKMILN